MRLEPGTQLDRDRRQRGGFELHAGVAVRADDRAGLERIARYLLRPGVATERLELLPGGDVLLRLKTSWNDGTTHLRLTHTQLLERLAVLVPRPQTNGVLYHGVFAANASWRPRLVSRPPPVEAPCAHDGTPAEAQSDSSADGLAPPPSGPDDVDPPAPTILPAPPRSRLPPRPNHTWADLMRRGLDIDSLDCPAACGGRLRLVALIEQPSVVRRILEHLGHDADPVGPKPARAPPPMDDFDWGA